MLARQAYEHLGDEPLQEWLGARDYVWELYIRLKLSDGDAADDDADDDDGGGPERLWSTEHTCSNLMAFCTRQLSPGSDAFQDDLCYDAFRACDEFEYLQSVLYCDQQGKLCRSSNSTSECKQQTIHACKLRVAQDEGEKHMEYFLQRIQQTPECTAPQSPGAAPLLSIFGSQHCVDICTSR